MINVLDEILDGEEKYKITDENDTVLYNNVKIEQTTAALQNGTPLNRALFNSIKGDLYRVDKYRTPTYSTSLASGNAETGTYIPTWNLSHYTKYGITVSATNETTNYEAYKAMNGVEGYWLGNTIPAIASPVNYNVYLNEDIIIKKFKITGQSATLYCKNFTLQGSEDGSNWLDIYSVSNNTYSETEYTTGSDDFYKYFRLQITASNSENDYPAISDFNITEWKRKKSSNILTFQDITLTSYENMQRLLVNITDTANVAFTSDIFPRMRTTNQDGWAIQSSGDYTGTTVKDAFDGDNEYSYWQSVADAIDRYLIVHAPFGINPLRLYLKIANVNGGKFQGSNDGDTWTDLVTNISTTDGTTVEEKTIDIAIDNVYRYFKFTCVTNIANTSTKVYGFEVTLGNRAPINYNDKTYVNINSLGAREVTTSELSIAGNYELVYDSSDNTYSAYLNSFSRALVENTFTQAEKLKLQGIEVGAEVNLIEGIKVNGTSLTPDASKIVNISAIPMTSKGTANGVATLDSDGLVPHSQLPSDVSVTIVTSVSSSSTDSEVPSAKCLYTALNGIESALSAI